MTIKQEDYDFFKDNGYLSLGKILSDAEVTRFVNILDRDRRDFGRFWIDNSIWQTLNCDALLTAPEVDELVRHANVMDPLEGLMGNGICFSEICLRHMGPYQGEPIAAMSSWEGPAGRRWHRDGGKGLVWPEHPLRLGNVQVMIYLSDVSDATHGFALSPQSIDQEFVDNDAQLERGGVCELFGCAGTAMLFNPSCLHTVTVRPTQTERKSVQIYYGHQHREYLSEDSYVPSALWRDHPDEEVRGFYGVLNNKTRKYLERTTGCDEVPVDEALEILAAIEI